MLKKLPDAQPLESHTADVEHYIREVWLEHCERRRNEFPLMSSAEFSLAYGWYEQGIHLSTVLRAMKDTTKSGSSLFYYRDQVNKAQELWCKAMQASA